MSERLLRWFGDKRIETVLGMVEDHLELTQLSVRELYKMISAAMFVDVGNVTTYRLDNLLDGVTYYVALTAYDTEGHESALSQEVSGLGVAEENPGPPPEIKDEDG